MGFIRKIIFGLRGPHNYTLGIHEVVARNFNPDALEVSCKGKSYLITGANGAMGKVVALEIAKRDGEVHMVCRNKDSARTAKKEIVEATKNKNVHLHFLDLSESRNVVKFAKKFSQSHKKLDALVNIAGARFPECTLNADGIECTFATNSLAPHILTRLLTPLLLESERGRVLMMTSSTMLLAKLSAKDPQLHESKKYLESESYFQTKRQMVVLAKKYAEQFPDMFSASANPGWVKTPLTTNVDPRHLALFRTPEQGADSILWLTISDEALSKENGACFENRRQAPMHLPYILTTRSSTKSENIFMDYMDQVLEKLSN